MKQSHSHKTSNFSLGPFMKCPHPEMVECLALSGFDFAVADMEHVFETNKQLYAIKLAAEARNFDIIVRIPMNSEEYFKWCLDLGFKYLQIPFVQSAKDANKAKSLAKFYPRGERGLCRFVRAANYSNLDKTQYIQQSNETIKLILQIEGVQGFENIDDIIAVPDIYAIFVGPYDLSQSLGLPGEIWHPTVVSAMKSIIEKCQKIGLKTGTFTDTEAGIKFWAELGVDFIEYASDLSILIQAGKKEFGPFRSSEANP